MSLSQHFFFFCRLPTIYVISFQLLLTLLTPGHFSIELFEPFFFRAAMPPAEAEARPSLPLLRRR